MEPEYVYSFKMKYEIEECGQCPFHVYDNENHECYCTLIGIYTVSSEKSDACKLIKLEAKE